MSVWTDIQKRSAGEKIRKEDEAQMIIDAEVASFVKELASYADEYLKKAKDAFMNNDRYTCAIFYTLYAIALNKDKVDIFFKEYLEGTVFIPDGIVSAELTLDENQKKELVDSIFKRSSGLGYSLIRLSFDFSAIEFVNFPFETTSRSKGFSFFDFIGICKDVERYPDIRAI